MGLLTDLLGDGNATSSAVTELFIPADGMGILAVATRTASSTPALSLSMPASGTSIVSAGLLIPDDWTSVDVFVHLSASSGTGDAVLRLDHKSVADDMAGLFGASVTTGSNQSVPTPGVNDYSVVQIGADIPVTGGALHYFRLNRLGDDAADTLASAGLLYVLGLKVVRSDLA